MRRYVSDREWHNTKEEVVSNPDTVSQSKWTAVVPLYDDGNFVVITGCYNGDTSPVCGIRWRHCPSNAGDQETENSYDGSGYFLLPSFLAEPMLHTLLKESLKHPSQERFCTNILAAIRTASKRVCPNSLQHAIALYGASNTGKTMTLNILIDLLDTEGKKTSNGGLVATLEDNYNPTTKLGDRCVAIRVFGKLVVVATFGDDGTAVQRGIDFALRSNADMLVAATRKRSDSSSWETFAESVGGKADIAIDAIEKIRVQDAADIQAQAQKQAEDLLSRIRLA